MSLAGLDVLSCLVYVDDASVNCVAYESCKLLCVGTGFDEFCLDACSLSHQAGNDVHGAACLNADLDLIVLAVLDELVKCVQIGLAVCYEAVLSLLCALCNADDCEVVKNVMIINACSCRDQHGCVILKDSGTVALCAANCLHRYDAVAVHVVDNCHVGAGVGCDLLCECSCHDVCTAACLSRYLNCDVLRKCCRCNICCCCCAGFSCVCAACRCCAV